MIEGDQVTVTVRLEVEPAVAFEVFTNEINLWWRGGVAYRVAGRRPGTLVMEGKVGGRLFEQSAGRAGPRPHQAGPLPAWAPPPRRRRARRELSARRGDVCRRVLHADRERCDPARARAPRLCEPAAGAPG